MEDKNHIDELFRTGLDQNFPVDENLWAQVENQLPISSNRKGFWIFNLNSLAIMAILSISMVLKSDSAETKQIEIQKLTESEIDSEQLVLSKNTIPSQKSTTTLKPESKTKSVETTSTISKNTPFTKNSISEETSEVIDNILITKESAVIAANKAEEIKVYSDNSIKSKKLNELSIRNEEISEVENNFQNKLKDDDYIISKQFKISDLKPLEPLDFYAMDNYLVQEPLNKKNFWNSKRKQYYYYELESNRSLNVNKQVSGLAPAIASYKTKRESAGSNMNFGLKVLTDHKYFQFGFGFNFSRYTEGINYTVDANGIGYDISFDTTYTVVNSTFNSNGELVLLIRSEIERIETEKGIIVKKNLYFRNEFERLQIPLLVGVHKNYGRFYGNLSASILLNYSIQQTGAYINNDLNSISNFEASEQINQFVIGNGYSASLGFSLNEFVVIGTRFNYETDLTSFTKEYSSKFNQYGLGVWLMWKPR